MKASIEIEVPAEDYFSETPDPYGVYDGVKCSDRERKALGLLHSLVSAASHVTGVKSSIELGRLVLKDSGRVICMFEPILHGRKHDKEKEQQ